MKSILLLAFIVATANTAMGQDGCIPTPAELDFRMWKGKNVGPCVDGCSCPELQDVWKVCTNEEDVNHKDVMTNCPVTCKIARGGCPGGCMPTRTELDFRMWPGKKVGSCVDGCSCQELQDGWKVCTNEKDVNHKGVMTKCPATCKIARGDCPATCAQPNTFLGGCPAAGCAIFDSVDDAKVECLKVSDCGGITVYPNGKKAELRKATKGTPSPRGETSMLKTCFGCGPRENGWCVLPNGGDQNDGVSKAPESDNWTEDECLAWCNSQSAKTGCEFIWDQGNRGCYLHTSEVDHGSGFDNHYCWICSDPCDIPNTYLNGYAGEEPQFFDSASDARAECLKVPDCGGITYGTWGSSDETEKWTLRSGTEPMESPIGETSSLRSCFENGGPVEAPAEAPAEARAAAP